MAAGLQWTCERVNVWTCDEVRQPGSGWVQQHGLRWGCELRLNVWNTSHRCCRVALSQFNQYSRRGKTLLSERFDTLIPAGKITSALNVRKKPWIAEVSLLLSRPPLSSQAKWWKVRFLLPSIVWTLQGMRWYQWLYWGPAEFPCTPGQETTLQTLTTSSQSCWVGCGLEEPDPSPGSWSVFALPLREKPGVVSTFPAFPVTWPQRGKIPAVGKAHTGRTLRVTLTGTISTGEDGADVQ